MRRWLRTVGTAFWLDWKVESNWTDPFLFVAYSIARPLAASLILVFMYFAVVRGGRSATLDFLVVGTAFWPFVLAGVRGMVLGIMEDRESYQTLRAIYTAPIPYRAYLVGRSLAQTAAVATPGAIVTLAVGTLALDVRFDLAAAEIPALVLALALGVAGIVALAIFTVGAALSMTSEAWQMPEGMATGLYLLCGAIYPITVLPGWLQGIAYAFPLTWWLEAVRRALLGPDAPASMPTLGNGEVLGVLALITAAWVVLAGLAFGLAETRARRLGILDERSGF